MSTEGCLVSNITNITTTYHSTTNLYSNFLKTSNSDSTGFIVYRLSYLWFAGLSLIITFILGIAISLLTGPVDSRKYDQKLFLNYSQTFSFFWPSKKKQSLEVDFKIYFVF